MVMRHLLRRGADSFPLYDEAGTAAGPSGGSGSPWARWCFISTAGDSCLVPKQKSQHALPVSPFLVVRFLILSVSTAHLFPAS